MDQGQIAEALDVLRDRLYEALCTKDARLVALGSSATVTELSGLAKTMGNALLARATLAYATVVEEYDSDTDAVLWLWHTAALVNSLGGYDDVISMVANVSGELPDANTLAALVRSGQRHELLCRQS